MCVCVTITLHSANYYCYKSNVCRACELSIKRSMKKKYNCEVYKLRKTFAVFYRVPLCFLEEELIG